MLHSCDLTSNGLFCSFAVKLENRSRTDNTDKGKERITSTPITPLRKRKGSSGRQESVSKFFKAQPRRRLSYSDSPENSEQNITTTNNSSQRVPAESQPTARASESVDTPSDLPYDFSSSMNSITIANAISQLPEDAQRNILSQLNLPMHEGVSASQQVNRNSGQSNRVDNTRGNRQFTFTAVNDQQDRLHARNRIRGSFNGNANRGSSRGRGNSRGRGSNASNGNSWGNRGNRNGRGGRYINNNGWRDANRDNLPRASAQTNTAEAGMSANAPMADNEIPIDTFDDAEIADALTVWWIQVGFPQKFFDKSQIGKVLFILHNFLRMHSKKNPQNQVKHDDIAHVAVVGGCAMITATNAIAKDWLLSAWNDYVPQTWDDEIYCYTIDHATATADNNQTSPLNNLIRIQTLDDDNKEEWHETLDLSRAFPFVSEQVMQFAGSQGASTTRGTPYVSFDGHIDSMIAKELFKRIGKGQSEHRSVIGRTIRVIRLQLLKYMKPSLSEIHPAAIAAIADHLGKSTDPMRKYNKGKFTEIWKFLKNSRFLAGIHSEDVNHNRISDEELDAEMGSGEDTADVTLIPKAEASGTTSKAANNNGRGGRKNDG